MQIGALSTRFRSINTALNPEIFKIVHGLCFISYFAFKLDYLQVDETASLSCSMWIVHSGALVLQNGAEVKSSLNNIKIIIASANFSPKYIIL